MPYKQPLRRIVKVRAKRLMITPLCLRVTLLVVAAQLAFFVLRLLLNGNLSMALVSLADYGDTSSGLYLLEEGISVIFRMDLTGMAAAVSATYAQLRVVVLVNTAIFLLLAPLRMGAMEVYWDLTRGKKEGRPLQVFRWFTSGGRLLKAWVVEFCLQVLVWCATFAASIPALYLFYRFYSSTASLASFDFSRRLLLWSADLLALAALFFGVWLHSLLLPVRYCLASHPEYGLGETFRRGFRSARGIRGGLYGFRLSYILWFFLSRLTYGAMDLFVLPYSSLGSMLYLQEAVRGRDREPAPTPPRPEIPEEDRYSDAAWPPTEGLGEHESPAGDGPADREEGEDQDGDEA